MSNTWSAKLRDAILDNSALRDGLSDDEAQPLIDWGLGLADQIGATLAALPSYEIDAAYEEAYAALPKLLTRMTWLSLYRSSKGSEWSMGTMQQINDLYRRLQGEAAPQLSTGLASVYAQQQDQLTQGELILDLIKHLSPQQQEGF